MYILASNRRIQFLFYDYSIEEVEMVQILQSNKSKILYVIKFICFIRVESFTVYKTRSREDEQAVMIKRGSDFNAIIKIQKGWS